MSRIPQRRHVGAALLVLCTLLGAGCKSKPAPLPPPDEVTPGSTLSVLKPFEIPAGNAGLYFQNQAPSGRQGLNGVDPYCRFVPQSAAKGPSVVAIGTYTVVTNEYMEDERGPGDRFVSAVRYALRGPLPDSDAQLTCVVPDVAAVSQFPTPAEISGALGAYFKLRLAK